MTLVPLGPGDGVEALLERGEENPRWTSWLYWFRTACNTAQQSLCLRSKCGAVVVGKPRFVQPGTSSLFEGTLLGVGYNSPPQDDPVFRRCGETQPSRAHPKAGRTCCVHAEVRALLCAPRSHVKGATLYFSRVDEKGILIPSGRPWCTECSKLALDLDVKTSISGSANGCSGMRTDLQSMPRTTTIG